MRIGVTYETPIGEVAIVENGKGLVFLGIKDKENFSPDFEIKETERVKQAYEQLCEYFEGKRTVFEVTFDLEGTEFQKKVWQALLEIPYGETCSYKDIAIRVGSPKACRAVGMANHRNPIAIMIPCHRVIGANGTMVGYGGGLHIKTYLLELEGSLLV